MNNHSKEDWYELQRAIKKLWANSDETFTGNLTVRFTRNFNDKDKEMSMFIVEADNCYNEEKGWKWEVFLNSNGSWHIA